MSRYYLALCLLLSACTHLTKPGPVHFPQDQEEWTAPLVGSLDNGVLMVPATIGKKGQHGPYLFVIDPDASVSSIDRGIAEELDLFTRLRDWRGFVDHTDTEVMRRPYEVLDMQIGTLKIRNFKALGIPAGSLNIDGRQVHGVIGRDLLSRMVSLRIDRDAGQIMFVLATHDRRYKTGHRVRGVNWRLQAPRRQVVLTTKIEGKPAAMGVDFIAPRTSVRPGFVSDLNQVGTVSRFDEFGSWSTQPVGRERFISLSPQVNARVPVAQWSERRFLGDPFDGVIGQDILSQYNILFRPDDRELWLSPRASSLAQGVQARLARFASFRQCQAPGCARVQNVGAHVRVQAEANGPRAWTVYLASEQVGRDVAPRIKRVSLRAGQSLVVPNPTNGGTWQLVDADPFPVTSAQRFASKR